MDESGTNEAECHRKAASGRRVAGAIKGLQLECVGVLHQTLLVPVLMYSSETMIQKDMEKSRIRAVQMDNLRGFLGIRRMDKVLNAQIRELCRVTKGVDKRIEGGGSAKCREWRMTEFIRWFM